MDRSRCPELNNHASIVSKAFCRLHNDKYTKYSANKNCVNRDDHIKGTSHRHKKSDLLIICAVNTGMRRGEILGLKWSQIRGGFIYLHKTKTKEKSEIPINDELEILLNVRNQHRNTYLLIKVNGLKISKRRSKQP